MMIIHGLSDNGQTQSRSRLFRRIVWLEYFRNVFRRNTTTAVRNLDAGAAALVFARQNYRQTSPITVHRLQAIDNEVGQC